MKSRLRKQQPWTGELSEFGLTRAPRTLGELDLAIAARDFVRGLEGYAVVKGMIESDQPWGAIVDRILTENPGKSPKTIRRYIQLYKTFFLGRLTPLVIRPLEEAQASGELAQAILNALTPRTAVQKIPEVAELKWACETQKRRVEAMLQIEAEYGGGKMLSPRTTRELREYVNMVSISAELQMETGDISRVPRNFNVATQESPYPNLPEDQRPKLAAIAGKMAALLDRVTAKRESIPVMAQEVK